MGSGLGRSRKELEAELLLAAEGSLRPRSFLSVLDGGGVDDVRVAAVWAMTDAGPTSSFIFEGSTPRASAH